MLVAQSDGFALPFDAEPFVAALRRRGKAALDEDADEEDEGMENEEMPLLAADVAGFCATILPPS